MSRGTGPRILTTLAVLTMVASFIGFIVTLMLNLFVFDEFDAYGEVPIPGSSSVHLPQGEVTISFHTIVIGGTNGGGLPVPQLSIDMVPPEGVPNPTLTEDFGSTTTVNNDARVSVWVAQIPAEGTYDITTDGNVGAFLNPTLAFGHGSPYWYLPFMCGAILVVAIIVLVMARVWAARVRRRPVPSLGYQTPPQAFGMPNYGAPVAYVPPVQPPQSFTPTEDGIRLQQLNTLARLRDSGALTEDEFQAEKKRVLDGS